MPAKIKQNTSQHQLKKPKNDSLVQNSWQDTEDQAKAEKKFLELLQNRDKNNSEISAEPENANDNSAKEIQKHLNSYLLAVKNTGCSAATIRNYKSDIKQFLDFLGENNLEALGSKPKLLAFAKYQREKGLKDSSIKRKIVSIGQFKNWLKDEGLLKSEIPLSTKQVKNAPSQDLQAIDSRIALEQELKAQQLVAQQLLAQQTQTHGGEDSTKLAQETKKRRSWFGQSKRGVGQAQHRPNKLALILNIIALLFFIGGLGYLAYQQFGQAVLSLAYPSLPTSPNRILSFQGRLTNTARTPIATQTDMVYKLYDNVTGGNLLWSSNTCTITPDQDGIFNTNLGAGAGDGSDDEDCGATIDDSVFTENSNVWLEVTVGNAPSSETLTPRQPIRTVAYAINAETVQGIRPSLIATHSTLLMLNDQGQLVLGTDNPEVKTATGSSLMVEADSIMIQTQAGSNGDIILAPDGIGNVGIGTTDPSEKLDVDGKIRIRTIDNAVGDILTTSATGIIQKRTAEELRGDIGAGREINSVYYVEGNTSGTAGTWTGNHDDVITYYDGLKVAYKIGIAGASTTRLNINNLGAVLVRRNNANLTTHLPVGTVVVLTYTTIAGTPYWVWADYDSNTTESYTVRWNNTLQAGAQITKYKIIMAGTDNKWYPLTVGDTTAATKTVASTEFLINSPILAYYTTPTIAPNATFTNIWEGINMAYLDYTLNQSSGMTAYAPVYLVGTINANGNFVLDGAGTANNNFWTQTLPTTEDGKVYIMIGIMHNTTTTMRLMVNKPMYEFKDGKIREYSDPDLSEYVPYSGATQDLDLGNNNLYVGGDVGIGTISPSYKLDVAGDINFTGALRANGSAGTIGQILLSQGANNPVWSDVSGAISDYAWLQGGNSFGSIGVLGTNDAYDLQLETGGATQMTIDTTGNVGIGTTDPAGKLHLNLGVGNINSSVYIDQTSSTGYSSITMRDERVSNSYVGQWGLYGSGVSAPNTSNMFFYNTAGGGIGFYVGSGGSPTNDLRMFIANSGNVGIGTTSPSYKLDVAGDINTTTTYRMAGVDYGQYFIDSAGSSSQVWKSDGTGRGYWATDETGTALPTGTLTGQTIYWNGTSWTYSNNLFNNNTSVGIGNTNPQSLLSVGATSQFRVDSSGNLVRINDVAYSWPSTQGAASTALINDGSGNLSWTDSTTLGTNYWDLENDGLSPKNTSLNLYVGGDSTASAKFIADGATGDGYFAGNVGIGTTNPGSELEVVGSITLDDEVMSVTEVTFDGDTSTGLKLTNPRGYITLTPLNTGWAHIYTDRTKFIFNRPVYSVDDAFSSYDADLLLQRAGTTEITVGSTLTTITDNLSVNGAGNNYFAGNVGIGTTSPSYKLDVAGDINTTTGTYRMAGVDYGQYFIDGAGTNGQVWKSDGSGRGVWGSDVGFANPMTEQGDIIYGGASGTPTRLDGSSVDNYVLKYDLDTNTPFWSLDDTGTALPTGTIAGQTIYWNGTSWTYSSNLFNNNSNVGIGTTNPTVKLDVAGQARFVSTSFPVVDIYRDTTTAAGNIYGGAKLERLMTGGTATNGTGIGFYFKSPDNAGNSTFAGMFGGALYDVANGAEKGEIVFGASYLGADPYARRDLVIRATGSSTSNVLIPNGNLGIRTTNPSYPLDVAGDINFTGALRANGSAGTSGQILLSQGSSNPVWSSVSGVIDDYAFIQGGNSFGTIGVLGTNDAYNLQFETGGTSKMTIDTAGNVGIGTTTPNQRLSVNGTLELIDAVSGDSVNQYYSQPYYGRLTYAAEPNNGKSEVKFVSKGATSGSGQTYFVIASTETGDTGNNLLMGTAAGRAFLTNAYNYGSAGTLHLGGYSWARDGVMQVSGDPVFATGRVTVDGKVGIGVASPSYPLDVAGDINTTGTYRMAGTDYGQYFIDSAGISGQLWSSDGSGRGTWVASSSVGTNYWDLENQGLSPTNTSLNLYVGGDATASAKFMADGNTGDINFTGALRANGNSGTTGQILVSQGNSNPVWSDVSGAISDLAWLQGGNSFGEIGVLGTNDAYNLQFETGGTTRMTIDTTGKVGIGNTTPYYPLDVAGDINTTGTYRMAGIDYGQYFIDSVGTSNQVWKSDGSGRGYWGADDTGTALPTGSLAGQTIYWNGTSWTYSSNLFNNDTSVGIGTTNPLSLFSVGATSQFRVDSAGNLVRINDVAYSWPSSQGAVSTALINDGSGNLSWVDSTNLGTNYWDLENQGLSPKNTSLNLYVGGDATASAKFIVDGNTGNINTANNTISWTLNNTVDALNFDSNTLSINALNNRVGIGTNSPQTMLHVGTTVMNTSWLGAGTFNRLNSGGDVTALTLYNTGTGGLNSSTSLAFGMGAGLGPTARITGILEGGSGVQTGLSFFTFKGTSVEAMRIDGYGNVGLGITTPSYKLDVTGDINLTGALRANGSSGTIGQILVSQNSSNPIWSDVTSAIGGVAWLQGGNSYGTTGVLGTNDAFDLQLEASGSTHMTITTEGNVGIGTTIPETQLHLTGELRAPKINKVIIVDGTTYALSCSGIQSAVDDLGSSGGEIYLPEGTYTCDTTIRIKAHKTTIRGAGNSTHIDGSSMAVGSGKVFYFDGYDYITIKDLKITGNDSGNSSDDAIFASWPGTSCTPGDCASNYSLIENIHIINPGYNAIFMRYPKYTKIRNNTVENGSIYIYGGGAQYNTIDNNKVFAAQIRVGEYVDDKSNIIINNQFFGGYSNIAVRLRVAGAGDALIANNVFYSGTVTGYGMEARGDNNIIINNKLLNTSYYGMLIAGNDHVIENNYFLDNGSQRYAIQVLGTSDNVRIANNTFKGFTNASADYGTAIRLNPSATNFTVINNTYGDSRTSIIEDGATLITYSHLDGGKFSTGTVDQTPDATVEIIKKDLNPLFMLSSFADGDGDYLYIGNNGLVGIGTTTPTQKLDIVGNLQFSGALMPGGLAGTSGYYLQSQGADTAPVWTDMSSVLLPTGLTGQTLRHDGTSWLANSLLYNDGTNIGIGTTDPSYKLDINSDSINDVAQFSSTTDLSRIILSNSSESGHLNINNTSLNLGLKGGKSYSLSLPGVVKTAFNSDGTKMYVLSLGDDRVYQYTLSTAWDVSSASYASKSFSVTTQEANPYGLAFNSDGTKMYVVGYTNDTVYQYTLSTAWDVSSASYASKSFSVTTQETFPMDVKFNSDGTKMYVIGITNDRVYQYSLSTAWDVSSASYASLSFSVTAQEATPYGLSFSADGTKMYVVGTNSDRVYQYSLSTAWDISSASYASLSFSFSEQQANPNGLSFSADGTKMYVIFYPSNTLYQYTLSTAWDISTASFNDYYLDQLTINSIGVGLGQTNPAHQLDVLNKGASATVARFLSNNSTSTINLSNNDTSGLMQTTSGKMHFGFNSNYSIPSNIASSAWAFALSYEGDSIYTIEYQMEIDQFSLSAPWSIGSISPTGKNYLPTGPYASASEIRFNNSGNKMYYLNYAAGRLYQYSLSTAWDITTSTSDNKSYYTGSQEGSTQSLVFSSDGLSMYIVGTSQNVVFQYSLSTAWDISTTSYSGNSFSVSAYGGGNQGLAFNNTGTKMYLVGIVNDRVYQFTLSTPWNVATASYDNKSYSIRGQSNSVTDLIFNRSGTKMYILDSDSRSIFEYSLSTAWDVSTASYGGNSNILTLANSGNVGIGTTAPSTLLQLGTAGTTAGTLSLAGATSGLVTINTAAAAGTWSMTLPTSAGTSGQVLTTNGSGVTSWAAPGSASNVALSGITAALSANSINNGDNAQVWNWQLTTAGKSAFTFGENTASTATGNAAILSASTLASSTAIPLYVKNLGAGASFRVDDEVSDTTPFVIDASGNVGIGTTGPLYKLDVNGDLRAEKFFDYTNVNYYLDPAAAGTSMTVAGSVGIGTTNPSSFKLQVAGNVGPNANDTYSLGSTALRWSDLYLGPSTLHLGTSATDEGLISYDTTNNILKFNTDSTGNGDIAFFSNQLYLDKSSGNVGIGTNTPGYPLDVVGNMGVSGNIFFGGFGLGVVQNQSNTGLSVNGNSSVSLTVDNNTKLTALSSGNVGIGTTSPTEKLTLNGGNFLHTASGNPTLKGTYDTNGEAFSVYVSGKYAYVADRASGLQIIDVSNPASPGLTGTYDTSGDARGVHVSGKYAYVADNTSGLQIIDISNPVSPSLTGTYPTGGYARDVYVSGKYAYVGDANASLKIIDISNPASPTLTSTYYSGFAEDVYVSDRYLYLALGVNGIRIIDINNPASPSLTGTLGTQDASGIYVSGKYAYVADGSSGLLIIDVSNPASPSLIGTYDTSGDASGVYVSGKYAYVADGSSGLLIIDVSNPASPSLIGTCNTSGTAFGIYVAGKYAYVADRNAGLQIIDINGIETPSLYAGNIQTNAMTITENLDLGNNLYVRNGLNVGMGGIKSDGIISSNGAYFSDNVGIGLTNPSYQLQLSTNSAAKPTSNAWTISSDSRLKTNIQNFSDGLDVIKAINPVSYVLNGKAGMPEGAEGIGIIAQEIKDIAPYTVGTFYAKLNPEDEFKTELYNFDSSALTFVLINAVKEQQLQIEDLLKTDVNLIASQSALLDQFNNLKDSLVASISSKLITTQKLIAEQIEVGGQNLDQYIKSVVQLALNNNELDLPQSESDNTPAQPTMLSELIIENDLGETVASIDNGGNAQLAGDLEVTGDLIAGGNTRLGQLLAEEASVSTLLAENISTENIAAQLAQVNQAEIEQANIDNAQINSASVSGELYAQNISTDNLHTTSIDAEIINGLQERLEAAVAQQLADSTLLASLTNDSSTTEEYLEQVATDMGTDLNSSSTDGTLDNTDTDTLNSTIMAYSAYIDSYFEVNGSALIKEALAVGQTLLVGNGLSMGDGYIAYQSETSNDLAIQPAGRGRLSLMANLMTLDESGLVTVNGDLKVAGAMEVEEDLKVKDTLLTNLISAENPNEGIRVQLAQAITNEEGNEEIKQSNFEFIDESGTPIATMSASGDLSLTGGLKVEQQPAGASESANLNNKSAGQAVIPAGATSVSIKTARLSENSMIYITPLGSTNNQVIYVKNKLLDSEFTEENEAQFIVGVDFALDQDVYFNWWLVN